MLQADKQEANTIKPYDIALCMIAAWVMSQAIISGSVFWFIIGYMFFINYAMWRREIG